MWDSHGSFDKTATNSFNKTTLLNGIALFSIA